MPPPLDPDKRQAIAQAIRDGGRRNEIARQFEVSPSTVTTIATQEGIDGAFDRSVTKEATAAARVDSKAWRADTARRLSRLASGVIESLEGMTAEEWAKQPPYFRMLTVAIAVDKVTDLERDESEQMAAVDAWLRSVVGG